MNSIYSVRKILKEYNIRPSKRFGQNFLIDQNISRKIIRTSGIDKKDIVVEIGPGLGALTWELCRHAGKVIAIEKDKRLLEYLYRSNAFDNLELIDGDILDYDFSNLHTQSLKIIGNLPYYISSPILVKLIENRGIISSIFVTVQKEFAERLTAGPGSKDYGSISCFLQFYAEPKILFDIHKKAFYPAPEITSCFLKINIRRTPLYNTDEVKLFSIIRTCFENRRKTILNSLSSMEIYGSKDRIAKLVNDVSISPLQRPETLSLKDFVKLSNTLQPK